MHFRSGIVNQRQECLKRYLRIFEYICGNTVHQVRVIVRKHTRYMQPLAVMLVRFVDAARQTLSQRIDRRNVVYVASRDETRDSAPVVNQHVATEALEEIQDSCVRFVLSENVYRHRPGGMQMKGFGRVNHTHHFPQSLIRDGVDIHIKTIQHLVIYHLVIGGKRSSVYEFGLDSFEFKSVVQVRPHAPCSYDSYFHDLRD